MAPVEIIGIWFVAATVFAISASFAHDAGMM